MSQPSLSEIKQLAPSGNIIPVYKEILADLLTPVSVYLKLTHASNIESFLFESVSGGEKIGRYSFIGKDPYRILKAGPNESFHGDPLLLVKQELDPLKYISIPGVPSFTGGAVGFIAYDCIRFFEPTTNLPLNDILHIPDAIFMFFNTIIVFDHLHHLVKIVSHLNLDAYNQGNESDLKLEENYKKAVTNIDETIHRLMTGTTPLPPQEVIILHQPSVSNIGKEGYEGFVHSLKHHITEGNIIQAVPSQRIKKKTTLHPFNAYRQLRSVNPSPYMYYVNLKDFQIVGASPEMLVKVENSIVYTHPIAGTRKRGKTEAEDFALTQDLLGDMKERAEHIMLVDLGRNDVNRICVPDTVKVDSLMHIEKYSHVMHIVSNVSGKLREDKDGYDAFRSIFPAGTVSGAPKVRAMELIYELEKEKRGVYAGAVGYFAYSGCIDTAIAIRTMVFKDGHVYLQAGGGIVHDSDPTEEYQETINKLMSNVTAIEKAEQYYYDNRL